MPQRKKVELDTRILFDGEVHTVRGWAGPVLILTAPQGHQWRMEMTALLETPGTRVLGEGEDAANLPREPDHSHLLHVVPEDALNAALERLAHLNEARFGYRSAIEAAGDETSPREEYATELPQEARWQAKADELGVGKSTLKNQWTAYQREGLEGLIDKKYLRPRKGVADLDPRAREAIESVIESELKLSKTNLKRCRLLVRRELKRRHGDDVVALPGRIALNAILHELGDPRGLFHLSKKTQRSIANRPPGRGESKRQIDRPGQRILIDITRLDVFAFDPVTGKWANMDLALALDAYTRSICGWRFTPQGSSALDAALLLHEVITPKRMRPGWPEEAKWRYHGVPDKLVHEVKQVGSRREELAGIPPLRPETAVIDHGWVFRSWTFTNACKKLGTNIEAARPFEPVDKDFVERVFRTIREALLMHLPGYKGPDVFSRAADVEDGAFLFVQEIEEFFASWVASVYQRQPHGGLQLPQLPKLNLSPNEMYDEALARVGFLYVPPDPDTYFELLPVKAVEIAHYGVHVQGLTYDGDALRGFRNARSGLGGRFGDKWPIAYDPRDLSQVYFRDPTTRRWHALGWRGARGAGRPFDDATLAYAKGLAGAYEPGTAARREALIDQFVNRLIDRIDRLEQLDDEERRQLGLAMLRAQQADADRPKTDGDGSSPWRPRPVTAELFDPVDTELDQEEQVEPEFTDVDEDLDEWEEGASWQSLR